MTEDTVLLSLKKYDELSIFYNGINEGKYVCVSNYFGSIHYLEEKDVIRVVKDRAEKLEKELDAYKKPNEKTLDDVKGMSLWQFLKWRKK